MRLLSVSCLLIAILWLALFDGSNAECCNVVGKLEFIVIGGTCGQVNAKKTRNGCSLTICANGMPLVGTFCGVGSCNVFGCWCRGGCHKGNYAESFLQRNGHLNIQIISTKLVVKHW
ncbi:protein Diedel [Drosophila rhopaloa]|uniref:Protein Diedel n=1 Tax=Drosophila rhopaloa TaxID=1041015 RepID=A0A6P4EFI3_DRORH|nr:protein Diedel [Drosophila rhopaloa]